MTQFAACWGVLTASLLIAAPVIFFKIKDTTSIDEDLKFSDATFEEVAPTMELEEHQHAHSQAQANANVAESDEGEKKDVKSG